MNDILFVDRVKKYFKFLEHKYGFKITNHNNSEIRPQTDGVVEYSSENVGVIIDSETGYATLRFFRIKDGVKHYITPIDIHEYLNTTDKEKELLLSIDPADEPTASELFNKKFMLHQSGWKGSRGSVEDLDGELNKFADWLKENASLCLEGELSWWLKFYEYKINRARADHLRLGKDEQGYARIKDPFGNWKLIKQSVFFERLEHVEKLKKELSALKRANQD